MWKSRLCHPLWQCRHKKICWKIRKKDPATFSIRSSSLQTKCIQRPKCTHPIAQSERVKENERRGEMIKCVHIDWMKLELCKCYRNKNNYTKEKKSAHTFSRSQPDDNIVWIWKRTTKKTTTTTTTTTQIVFLFPSRFGCLCASTEWYTRNGLAPVLLQQLEKTERFKPRAVFGFEFFALC